MHIHSFIVASVPLGSATANVGEDFVRGFTIGYLIVDPVVR
jgi:hypothetical protein